MINSKKLNHECSWIFPVMTEKSNFVATNSIYQDFNLQIRNGGLPGIYNLGFKEKKKFEEKYLADLAFCDYQTGLIYGSPIPGSARSFFYRDHYLKGIGLTPIAKHWLSTLSFHGTGHLLPSQGFREYLITDYIKKKIPEWNEYIVPCTGLLFGKIDKQLTEHVWETYRYCGQAPACDLKLKAISVKSGYFTRYSNFIWDMNSAEIFGGEGLYSVLNNIFYHSLPETQYSSASSIDEMFSSLFSAGWLTFERFLNYHLFGISWHSMNNNFTSDGRMLDLELPTLVGCPFIGIVSAGEIDRDPISIEAFHAVFQFRAFILSIQSFLERIESLNRVRKIDSKISKKTSEIRALLVKHIKKSPIFNDNQLIDYATSFFTFLFSLNSKESFLMREMVSNEFSLRVRGMVFAKTNSAIERFPLGYSIELGLPATIYIPKFLRDRFDYGSEDRIKFSEKIKEFEKVSTVSDACRIVESI